VVAAVVVVWIAEEVLVGTGFCWQLGVIAAKDRITNKL